MPRKSKKNSSPQVEEILDKRKGPKSKLVEYYVKWEGRSSSESTWELRKNLMADGFGTEIRAWEKEQKAGGKKAKKAPAKKRTKSKSPAPKKKKKAAATPKRGRSKSPAPKKKTPKKSKTPTPKKKASTPKSSASPAASGKSTPKKLINIPDSYGTIDVVTENFTGWIVMFLIGMVGTVTLRLIENDGNVVNDADAEWLLRAGKLIVEPIAPLWCLLVTFRKAPAGEMTNPACAAILWVCCLVVLENLTPIIKGATSSGFEASISVYVALFMWQAMTFSAVSNASTLSNVVSALASAGAVHLMREHWFVEGSSTEVAAAYAQYLIAIASVFAAVSAISKVGSGHASLFSSEALPQWVLAFAVLMGAASVFISLTEMNSANLDLGTKDATNLWLANNLMRWFMCSALSLVTILQDA